MAVAVAAAAVGGGRAARADSQLGGRGGRGQSPYQGSATYTVNGSGLDSTPLQPRNGVIQSAPQLPFAGNNFGATFGGPVKIPGLYADTKRRTSFQVNYTGSHSTSLQDQFLTVPTDAMRSGDFSGSTIQLVDPKTGLPFANNQIPKSAMDPSALALLNYIPTANVPGVAVSNFRNSATTLSTSNSVSVRFNENLTPNLPTPGQRGARRPVAAAVVVAAEAAAEAAVVREDAAGVASPST